MRFTILTAVTLSLVGLAVADTAPLNVTVCLSGQVALGRSVNGVR